MGNRKDTGVRTRAPRARARVVTFVKPQFLTHEAEALKATVEAALRAIDAGEAEATLADMGVLQSVLVELERAIQDAAQGRR